MITKANYFRKIKEWGEVFPNSIRDYDNDNEYFRKFNAEKVMEFRVTLAAVMDFAENIDLPDSAESPDEFCDPIIQALREDKELYKVYDAHLRISIHKSFCLARLLYGGEELRTVPCPEHKGEWSFLRDCVCGDSGFLPETESLPASGEGGEGAGVPESPERG